MKTIYTLLLGMLFLPAILLAQETEDMKLDTTEMTIGKNIVIIVKDSVTKEVIFRKAVKTKENGDEDTDEKRSNVEVGLFGLDLGVNMLLHDGSINMPPELKGLETRTIKSTHVGLHFIPTRFNLVKHKLNLITALDIDVMKLMFQNNITLVPRMDSLTFSVDSIQYDKNRLTSTYLQVPLLLNFRTNPKGGAKNFRISAGGYAGVLVGANTKIQNDEIGKIKQRDDFNLERFRYGLTARIGYGWLDFYVNYNLSSHFRKDQAPEVIPISFGVNLLSM